MAALAAVEDLVIAIGVDTGTSRHGSGTAVVDGMTLHVGEGEAVGLVGESGSGKTLTTLALTRLLPDRAVLEAALLEVGGVDILRASEKELDRLRGTVVGYVFQEPAQALNPLRPVWYQVTEAMRLRERMSHAEARERTVALLAEVGLEDPEALVSAYPHQLSGGQRQRVMIAGAIGCQPDLLVADEPTSALDPVSAADLVIQLAELCERHGMALLFVSHDLALVGGVAGSIVVAYAGETVEEGSRRDILTDPAHPYAQGLLRSVPGPSQGGGHPFPTIVGTPARAGRWPAGCRFEPRCPFAFDHCRAARPALTALAERRRVRCFLYSDEEDRDG
jgi:peptide/nickel transport system ATP-binding protein